MIFCIVLIMQWNYIVFSTRMCLCTTLLHNADALLIFGGLHAGDFNEGGNDKSAARSYVRPFRSLQHVRLHGNVFERHLPERIRRL